MAKKGPSRRHVVPHGNSGWAVKAPWALRASSVHPTQAEALARAKEIVANEGGGEVTVHGKDGKIRGSETVAPAPAPTRSEDTKH